MTQPFTRLSATAAVLDKDNIDTDQLLPKQFLTGVTRTGYGKNLFFDWRYIDGDIKQPNPDFVLNQTQYKGAKILISGANFGCGSSREHAPWALADFGFKVVIAPSFADIFHANCLNNQILPICLSQSTLHKLMVVVTQAPSLLIHVDLPVQTIGWLSPDTIESELNSFEIKAHQKENLINGWDKIAKTLHVQDKIKSFEQQMPDWLR